MNRSDFLRSLLGAVATAFGLRATRHDKPDVTSGFSQPVDGNDMRGVTLTTSNTGTGSAVWVNNGSAWSYTL